MISILKFVLGFGMIAGAVFLYFYRKEKKIEIVDKKIKDRIDKHKNKLKDAINEEISSDTDSIINKLESMGGIHKKP